MYRIYSRISRPEYKLHWKNIAQKCLKFKIPICNQTLIYQKRNKNIAMIILWLQTRVLRSELVIEFRETTKDGIGHLSQGLIADPRKSRISKKCLKFRPKFLESYGSINGRNFLSCTKSTMTLEMWKTKSQLFFLHPYILFYFTLICFDSIITHFKYNNNFKATILFEIVLKLVL